MAIYQYNISLLPRQPIIDKFGKVPSKLFIDHEARQEFLANTTDFDAAFNFQDDLTIDWWKDRRVRFKDIQTYIFSFSKPIEWTKDFEDLKSYMDNEDSDNDLSIDIFDNEYIQEFSFRINVARLSPAFIGHIITIANNLDCVIVDRHGNLFEPTYQHIADSIKSSNAFRFCTNPKDFFDKLSTGEIKPE